MSKPATEEAKLRAVAGGSPDLLQRIREAEAAYRGFPAFADWNAPAVELRTWDAFRDNLAARRQQTDAETLRRAIDVALRAAAVDTGPRPPSSPRAPLPVAQ